MAVKGRDRRGKPPGGWVEHPAERQLPLCAQIEAVMKMDGTLLVRKCGSNQASYLCPGFLPPAQLREALRFEIAALPHG